MFKNVLYLKGLRRYQKVCAPPQIHVLLSKIHTKKNDTLRNYQRT
jgi:hypothetical protein